MSQTFLAEVGINTPFSIVGPLAMGGLLAFFAFAFENPNIIMNAGNPKGMFNCFDPTSCYFCVPGATPPQPPFTPNNDPGKKIKTAIDLYLTVCNASPNPPDGCRPPKMPCA